MTKWYSQLIATPVVDKNGKLTTVHKKTATEPSSAKSLPVNLPSQDKQGFQGVINALPKWCREPVVELAQLSHNKDRDIIGGAAELLLTGSENAQRQALSTLVSFLSNMKTARNPVFLYSRLLTEMTVRWHTTEVAQQAGLPPITDKSYMSTSSRVLQYDRQLDSGINKNSDYWRSLAFLAFARIDEDVMDTPMFNDFVEWNKTEPDSKYVINTMRERHSYDPRLLQELINQQAGKNSALHSGFL